MAGTFTEDDVRAMLRRGFSPERPLIVPPALMADIEAMNLVPELRDHLRVNQPIPADSTPNP